jgi:UDP-N-acetylmuramyl pentapeptide phosphotransferase/UDP-N-acetylglucosamine-1-phosphate transferase
MSLVAVLGFLAIIATYWGVKRFRAWAEQRQIIDMPNERSSHTRPTPRGGGLIIVGVTLFFGAILAAALVPDSIWHVYLPFAAGAILVASISWLDDLRSLSNSARLAAHLSGAVIAIAGLGYWRTLALPFLGTVTLGWWGALITALWIVGLTNAYNFMDGTDGIAGGQAVIGGLGWAFLGWQAGQPLVSGLGFVVACSSTGFLVHNWPPARIFMGDVGSAFLGYTLAVLPVMFGFYGKESPGAPVVGLMLVWPFVFDTTFTFIRRLFRRENVFAAHRSHLYQRISTAHSGHARVALLYSGLALVGVILAQVWSARVLDGEVTCLLALPVLFLGLWAFVVIDERRQTDGTKSGLTACEQTQK